METPGEDQAEKMDALQNIFVDVTHHQDTDDYSDEEEAQFHARYQEKHFM